MITYANHGGLLNIIVVSTTPPPSHKKSILIIKAPVFPLYYLSMSVYLSMCNCATAASALSKNQHLRAFVGFSALGVRHYFSPFFRCLVRVRGL